MIAPRDRSSMSLTVKLLLGGEGYSVALDVEGI